LFNTPRSSTSQGIFLKLPPCLKTQAHKLNKESERNEMEKERKEEELFRVFWDCTLWIPSKNNILMLWH
jgi:hypothetical protein